MLFFTSRAETRGFLRLHHDTFEGNIVESDDDDADSTVGPENVDDSKEPRDDGNELIIVDSTSGEDDGNDNWTEDARQTEDSEGESSRKGEDEENDGDDKDRNIHVACEVAEREVDMLVDTGASVSIISEPLARRLGLLSHLDETMQGVANGVGQAQIMGRLWDIPVKLGHAEFALTFFVLDTKESLLLLGVDQLRRFKCVVDLERNCLMLGGSNGVEIPFLSSPRG